MLGRSRFWLLCLVIGSGCAPKGPVRAALYEDLPSLKRQIELAHKQGKLRRDEVVELAEAVLAREVASAKGSTGVHRVRSLRACAPAALPELRRRSQRDDEVAAEAMLIRLSLRDVDRAALFGSFSESKDPAWRALAARSALAPKDAMKRRSWFVDPDQRVRRAAFEAAIEAPLALDVPVLLESFRLDPDPLSRSLAARAVGALGGEASVFGLKDRYARADAEDRLTIVEAWAMPASFAAGGAQALRRLADAREGLPSVAAALALIRNDDRDGSLVGLLVSAIEGGSLEERRLAMVSAPLSDARVATAIEGASKEKDSDVRVIALARLLDVPAARAGAHKVLRELAAKSDEVAAQARAALAATGDRSVVPALSETLRRGHPARRAPAAIALFRLAEPAVAALALGDSDPGVRISVACGIASARR